jgi:alanine dehydrogenase
MVGKHAVEAATKLGNVERNTQHIADRGLGSVAIAAGRNLITNRDTMEKLFNQTDILVDATQRRNPSEPVVPNEWIAWLPEHAVLCDLAVDPYTLDTQPVVVRGIEGIPQGSLDQYVFAPDDPSWDKSIPASIPSDHRRTAVTCYSWPGIHPEACMRHYAQQLEPLIEVFVQKGYDGLSIQGSFFERAMARGSLRYWLQTGHYEPRPR